MSDTGSLRPRTRIAVAIAAVVAIAGAGLYSGLAQAGGEKHKGAGHGYKAQHVSCELKLIAVKPPRTREAENFGTISCDKRFLGEGVQHDSSIVTPTSQLSGHFTGPVKQFFDRGTLSGTFTINYVTDPATLAVTYNGTIDLTKGTGRYRGVRGTGTLTGGSPDAIKTTIQEELTLTHKKHR
ncbi:MAG: hypothetical protein ACRDKY_12555 [Solirubrobacteraceae bacterium]